MAASAAAVDESTFIWNPNLIALSSAIALAGAWKAWSGGDRRWWLVAAIGTAITMQCHVLGVALLPVIAAPFLLDARRRTLGLVWAGVLAILLIAYVPLVVNELTTGFSEARAAAAYLASDRSGADVAIPIRFGIVALRVLSWPLTGLITDGFIAGSLATVAVIAITVWRWRSSDIDERFVVRWFGLGLLWSVVFLTVAAPSLAAVVRGLPNDHYHAFADPMVFVLVGLGAAALVREVRAPVGPLTAASVVVLLLGWNLTHLPLPVHPDGGFPAGDAAAQRVDDALTAQGVDRTRATWIRSMPDFKSTEALVYPLARLGRAYSADLPKGQRALGSAATPDACGRHRDHVRPAIPRRERRRLWRSRRRTPRRTPRAPRVPRSSIASRRARTLDVGLRLSPRLIAPDMRTPAPQTPAFAVPETRTVEGDPGRALECSSSGRSDWGRARRAHRADRGDTDLTGRADARDLGRQWATAHRGPHRTIGPFPALVRRARARGVAARNARPKRRIRTAR
jgi:hypothetical protein